MVEDTLFYSVEQHENIKKIHILGNVSYYHLGSDRKDDHRLIGVTDVYLDFKDVESTDPESVLAVLNSIYHNGKLRQDVDITSEKAWECFDKYIEAFNAKELNLFECNNDTPCGNYWCDMSDV